MWQNNWEREIREMNKGKDLFEVKSKLGKWAWASVKSRSVESALTRLRIGHVGLNQHLFRMHMTEEPLCECGDIESREHFLLHCVIYSQQRQLLVAELRKLSVNMPITVKLLLGGEDLPSRLQSRIVHCTGKFLINTGRLTDL